MGIITSRIHIPFFQRKTPEVFKKELDAINKNLFELEKSRRTLNQRYEVIVDLITTYSRILYTLIALVFFFTRLPSTFLEYVFFCGSFIIFYLLIRLLKLGLKWYYEYELVRNVDKIKKLQNKKKGILCKVKETTQFKEAKEIIEKYGPEKKVKDVHPQAVQRLPSRSPSEYLDNIVSYVLNEQKENALICLYCKWHNGMALEDEYEYIGFRCCHCHIMNPPRKIRTPSQSEKKNA